jgi:hypothetical protein
MAGLTIEENSVAIAKKIPDNGMIIHKKKVN